VLAAGLRSIASEGLRAARSPVSRKGGGPASISPPWRPEQLVGYRPGGSLRREFTCSRRHWYPRTGAPARPGVPWSSPQPPPARRGRQRSRRWPLQHSPEYRPPRRDGGLHARRRVHRIALDGLGSAGPGTQDGRGAAAIGPAGASLPPEARAQRCGRYRAGPAEPTGHRRVKGRLLPF
jgi:hypothetical protein